MKGGGVVRFSWENSVGYDDKPSSIGLRRWARNSKWNHFIKITTPRTMHAFPMEIIMNNNNGNSWAKHTHSCSKIKKLVQLDKFSNSCEIRSRCGELAAWLRVGTIGTNNDAIYHTYKYVYMSFGYTHAHLQYSIVYCYFLLLFLSSFLFIKSQLVQVHAPSSCEPNSTHCTILQPHNREKQWRNEK